MGRTKGTEWTPEKLDQMVTACIDYCEAENKPPTSYALRRFGLTEEALDRVRDLERESETLSWQKRRLVDSVRRLDEFRTAFWLRQGLENPRLASFAAFNLRQPRNGGYSERQTASRPAEILVKLDGVGEDAFD